MGSGALYFLSLSLLRTALHYLIESERLEQANLARSKDVFGIMPTGFGKTLIFQLFPRLAKAALTLENSTIIVVSPLISIMRDQVEQLKKLGFSAAAIWHR